MPTLRRIIHWNVLILAIATSLLLSPVSLFHPMELRSTGDIADYIVPAAENLTKVCSTEIRAAEHNDGTITHIHPEPHGPFALPSPVSIVFARLGSAAAPLADLPPLSEVIKSHYRPPIA